MRANERERGRVKSILVNYLPGFPTRHTTRPGWLPKAEVIHRGDSVLYVHLREGPYNLQGSGGPIPKRIDTNPAVTGARRARDDYYSNFRIRIDLHVTS